MSYKCRVALLALLSAVLLAACGGGTRTVTRVAPAPTTSVPSPAPGHPCDPSHYYMQCALLDQQPPVQLPQASFRSQAGIDFAWGTPSCRTLRSLGYRFAARYFSFDSGKNWSPALVAAYHRDGCATVGVWETIALRATAGFSAGRADALSARSQAAAVGNTRDAIDFAIDCDCSGPSVYGYFLGAHSVLGSRTNAYGGYYPLEYLCAKHVVGNQNWQTYAWSGGRWLSVSCAPLEQWSNDHTIAGVSVDLDRALAANYGQWPTKAAPPRLRCFGPHAKVTDKTCRRVRAQVASDQRAAASSERAYVARSCVVLAQRDRFFGGQLKAHPRSRQARRWSGALRSTRAAERERSCSTFSGRAAYFRGQVKQIESRY